MAMTIRPKTCAAQAPPAHKIPTPDDLSTGITITDGADGCVGTIVLGADGQHHLFAPNGKWLASYPTRQAAMRALPILPGPVINKDGRRPRVRT